MGAMRVGALRRCGGGVFDGGKGREGWRGRRL